MHELAIAPMRNLVELINFVTSHSHLDFLAVQIVLVFHERFMSELQDNEDFSQALAYFDQLMENSHFRSIRTRQISFDSREWPADESKYLAHTTLIKTLVPLLDKEGIISFGKPYSTGKIISNRVLKLKMTF
jgi:hypothetical protein